MLCSKKAVGYKRSHETMQFNALRSLVIATADISSRSGLRSASTNRYEPHTTRLKFGERCFSHAGPKAWNALPADIQDLTDETSFKRRLKTFLFQQAYTVQ